MELEFIGRPGPHRDVEEFIRRVRFKRPQATDLQIERAVHQGNTRLRPRLHNERFVLFGADVMTDELHKTPWWSLLPKRWRRLLPTFPIHGGTVFQDTESFKLDEAMRRGQHQSINRASVQMPPGLSKTYVWAPENHWITPVTDQDAHIIRSRRALYVLFRPAEGNPLFIEGYSRQSVGSPIVAGNMEDVDRIARDVGIED